MARVLGYGGIGNTNGARSFSGKETAVAVSGRSTMHMRQNSYMILQNRGFRSIVLFFLLGVR